MQPSWRGMAIGGAAAALIGAAGAVAAPSIAVRAAAAALIAIGLVLTALAARRRVAAGAEELAAAQARVDEAQAATEAAQRDAERSLVKVDEALGARAHIVATERDLDQARRMYRQILPLLSAVEHGPLCLVGSCTPAAETGGDWWTYRKLPDGNLLLVLGDATGHGVHSAMIGCAAHGAVKALAQIGEKYLTPRGVVDAVHAAIRIPGNDHTPMTLFAAQIDPKVGEVRYRNDGHVFPLIVKRDAAGLITEVGSITGERGNDLVDTDDSTDLTVRTGQHPLTPGQVLICFTDGLVERESPAHRPFGMRRLAQTLVGATVPHSLDGVRGLRDLILKRIEEYAEGQPVEDDITLLLCSVAPEA